MVDYSCQLLRMTLCDPNQRERELDVHFRIFDTRIARHWADLMVFLTQRHALIPDPERFYNFPNDPKASSEWIRAELRSCLQGLAPLVAASTDHELDGELTQSEMNRLHEVFVDGCRDLSSNVEAMLRGGARFGEVKALVADRTYWESVHDIVLKHTGLDAASMTYLEIIRAMDGSPEVCRVLLNLWFVMAPASPYLERLNIAIHRWEDWCSVRAREAQRQEGWKYQVVTFFPCRSFGMTTEDCKAFTIRDVFGRLYLDDITEGKSIWDVYRDKDDIIVGEHYKSLAYFWGNFRVYYGPTHTESEVEAKLASFWRWFEANGPFLDEVGFRRDDPRMTIGSLPVADLEPRGVLAGLGRQEIVDLVARHQHVKRVAVVADDGTAIRDSLLISRFGGWSALLDEFRKNRGVAIPFPND
jgi:hypothetical protein